MTPFDVGNYIARLERMGFTFLVDGIAIDVAVVDQRLGPTRQCEWLKMIYFDIDDDQAQRCTAVHMIGKDPDPMFTPDDWSLEQHQTLRDGFVLTQDLPKRLKYLGREQGLDVYRDQENGEIRYTGRSSGH